MDTRLPSPSTSGEVSVEAAIADRRSCRSFAADRPVSLSQLSQILWAAQGITDDDGRRAAPSAGALHQLHVLVAVGAVGGVEQGLHRYRPGAHSLALVAEGDHRPVLERCALDDQPWVGRAALVLVVVAEMHAIVEHFRDQSPPGERGRRYAQLETGAVAENVHLQAAALGLGCVVVAGFDDGALSSALRLRAGQEPTTMLALGPSAG